MASRNQCWASSDWPRAALKSTVAHGGERHHERIPGPRGSGRGATDADLRRGEVAAGHVQWDGGAFAHRDRPPIPDLRRELHPLGLQSRQLLVLARECRDHPAGP